MIDIDDFKSVNSQYGNRAGGEVLEKVAYTLIQRVRPGDYIFRYDGEKFLATISETKPEAAAHVAEDNRRQVQECTAPDVEGINISISIGVAEYDFHPDFMRTVDAADKCLYQAKRTGKNRVVWTNSTQYSVAKNNRESRSCSIEMSYEVGDDSNSYSSFQAAK